MAKTLDGADADFAARVNRLMSETNATLESGVRSRAEQEELYRRYQNGTGNLAAKPGTSNHEHGKAADIGNWQGISNEMLAQYGLKRTIPSEPWHIEPIEAGDDHGAAPVVPAPLLPGPGQEMSELSGGVGRQTSHVGVQVPTVGKRLTSAVGKNAMAATQTGVVTTPGASPLPSNIEPITSFNTPATDLDSFMNAIAVKESGGNYNAKNKDSGASGKYQIMPSNWPSWSQEAGLGPNAAMTPQNQEAVARYKMQSYYQKFGNWHDVAVAWYAGPGAVEYKNKNASQGSYPTINQYANDIIKRMG